MKKYFGIIVCLISLFVLFPNSSHANTYNSLPTQQNVPIDKQFTITFSQKVDIHSIDDNNVYVKDARGNILKDIYVALEQPKQKKIIVRAPKDGYKPNSSYTLYVENGIESHTGKKLLQPTKMAFTTGNAASEKFQVRKDSLNDVVYSDNTVVLSEQQGNALMQGEVQDQQFIFNTRLAPELASLNRGEIIVFPATDASPTGFAKKVVSVSTKDNQLIIKTSEPTLNEVIKDIDVSKSVAITTDDFQVSNHVEQLTSASLIANTDRKKTFKNKDGSIAYIEFKDKKDETGRNVGTIVQFDNFKYDILNNGHYTPLDGTMTFIRPEVTLDARKLYTHHLQFTTALQFDIDKTLTLAKFEKDAPKRAELPINIPVKFAGAIGGKIIPYLELEASGEIKFGFHIGYEANVDIGIRRAEDGWEGFNDSSLNPYSSMNSLIGSIEGRLSAGLAIQANVFQFALGGVEGAAFANAKIDGELSSQKTCYNVDVTAGVRAGAYVGDSDKSLIRINVLEHAKDLLNVTKCEMAAIDAKDLTVEVGKTKQIAVTATDLNGHKITLELPNQAISFKSANENILTVSKHGVVKVAKNAPKDSVVKVIISYHNIIGKALTKEVFITIMENENLVTDKPDLETIEKPKPVNKTYTIKEWGLSFDLPKDVKNYTVKENYGYHIYRGDIFLAYIERYDKDFEPSFRGYWDYLGTKGDYSYYVISGFNIFFDDENSPNFKEQSEVLSSISKTKKFVK